MLHTIGRNADLLDQAITSAAAKSTCRRAAGEEANSWAKLLRPTAWFPANDVPDEHTSDGDNSSSGVNDSGAESLGEGDSDSQIEERSEDEACSNDDEEAAESSEEESVFSGDNSNVIETPNVTHQLPDIAKQQNDGAPSDASLLSQYTAHMTEAQVMAAHLPPSARERVHALEGGHGKVHHTISRSEDWIAGLLRCAQMSVNQTDTQKVAEQPQDALPQQIGSDHVQQSPEKLKKDSTFEEMLKQAGELAKPTQGRKLPIKFKDPIGRALNFEWHVCRTWEVNRPEIL